MAAFHDPVGGPGSGPSLPPAPGSGPSLPPALGSGPSLPPAPGLSSEGYLNCNPNSYDDPYDPPTVLLPGTPVPPARVAAL